jgi:hypothetical protein
MSNEYKDYKKAAVDRSELHFRRAVLYNNMTVGSDMLQVRILPDMSKYDAEDLPYYGCFNSSMVIKGVAEKDTRDVNTATQLWVVCTNDYVTGWVIGEAGSQMSITDSSSDASWGFKSFKTHLLRCHLNTDSAVYDELKVLFNNSKIVSTYEEAGIRTDESKATAVGLDVVNVRTGERFMMLQSGTIFALTQDTLYMRVGSPDQDSSYIRMTAGSIEMTANNVIIYGRDKTSIGKHGMHVVGMLGAATAIDGSPLVPLTDITC